MVDGRERDGEDLERRMGQGNWGAGVRSVPASVAAAMGMSQGMSEKLHV
jgi:hypothetical protein